MRRRVVGLVVAVAVLAAGAGVWRTRSGDSPLVKIAPDSAAVAAAERARRVPGAPVNEVALTAAPATVQIGGRSVSTWAFNGTVPGPEIRVAAGAVIEATVRNRLPQPLTIHWHGIALRSDMDGVPGVTQKAIPPGGEFTYTFTAPDPGTYFYHPHTGTQLDRGLYAPLIVEEPTAPATYDGDVTLLLDDWTDGVGESPDAISTRLQKGMGAMPSGDDAGAMEGMDGMSGMEGMSDVTAQNPLGADTGDITYPMYVVNGKAATDPAVFDAGPGERVRLRLVNAGSDTAFRVAVGGRPMTVIATDGYPVEPANADALLIGMGERYDVVVTAPAAGTVPVVAVAEGKGAQALAVLRAGPGPLPAPDVRPAELAGRLLALRDLTATPEVTLPPRSPDRTYRVRLTGDMASYNWRVVGPTEDGVTLPVRDGERVRLVLDNQTMMWHPMHLHGHTFQVVDGSAAGPRKDTVIVPPMGRLTVEFAADNPGQWALHCHNIYHAEAGMVTVLSYVR